MARILLANDYDPALRKRGDIAWYVQRAAWFAQDEDILVFPVEPDDGLLEYITSLTGTNLKSLRIVVPPPQSGAAELTARRLTSEASLAALREVLADRPIDQILSLWPDPAVAALARSLKAEAAVPGFGFLEQGGGALVSSKAVFRALAAGLGLPIPHGTVTRDPWVAEDRIVSLLREGHPVIVKREYLSGGHGNEVLSPIPDISYSGARCLEVLTDRTAVQGYLDRRWGWLTEDGRDPIVIERYFPDSSAYFVEYSLTERGPELSGHGAMMQSGQWAGEIMPAPWLPEEQLKEMADGGHCLCNAVHLMGYRGRLSVDAIVTLDNSVLFTEYNGRVTGSTHIYEIIGKKIVGPGYYRDRVLLEWMEDPPWPISTFGEAVDLLAFSCLGYSTEKRTGIVLASGLLPSNTVTYCVVGETVDAAVDIERQFRSMLGIAPVNRGPGLGTSR